MFLFDTGAHEPVWTELAGGYLRLLTPLMHTDDATPGERGPYVGTLKQVPHEPNETILNDGGESFLSGPLPAMLVSVLDSQVLARNARRITWMVDVRVHLISGYAGQLTDGRLNADLENRTTMHDPGIFVMAQHVVELLHGQPPMNDGDLIEIEGLRHGATTQSWSWWGLDTACKVTQAINPRRDAKSVDQTNVKHKKAGEPGTVVLQRI